MKLQHLRESPCWLFLLLLVYAPWAYGSIPAWAERVFLISGGSIFLAFGVLNFFQFRTPPRWIALVSLALLLQGWWMTLNAQFILEPSTHRLLPLEAWREDWAGSYNKTASHSMMIRLSVLCGLMWMAGHMASFHIWRKRMVFTIGLTAGTLLLFGIWQKIMVDQSLWPQYGKNVWPFATYFYHGNAGAFINLCLPVVVALAWRSAFVDVKPLSRALWVSCMVMVCTAAMVNASKAASVIFVGLVVSLALLSLWFARKVKVNWKAVIVGIIVTTVIVGSIAIVALSGGIGESLERWMHALNSKDKVTSGRLQVAGILWQLAPQVGAWGFGPATFSAIFPYVARLQESPPFGYWMFAHQDYLQTFVEWGYVGFGLWMLLIWGAVLWACFVAFTKKRWMRKRDVFLLLSIALAVVGCLIHALVDFPLQIVSLQFYVAVYVGMLWSSGSWFREFSKHQR